MKRTLKIFFEGGAKGDLAEQARVSFGKFLAQCSLTGVNLKVKACGPRQAAYRDFKTALANGDEAILLIDAEDVPNPHEKSPWKQKRIQDDKLTVPPGAKDDELHFFAATMEAWLVACPDILKEYFGQGFNGAKLPKAKNLESVSKQDLQSGLEKATKQSKVKGVYNKGRDSFVLLEKLDPQLIVTRCPYWAKRFCDELKKRGLE